MDAVEKVIGGYCSSVCAAGLCAESDETIRFGTQRQSDEFYSLLPAAYRLIHKRIFAGRNGRLLVWQHKSGDNNFAASVRTTAVLFLTKRMNKQDNAEFCRCCLLVLLAARMVQVALTVLRAAHPSPLSRNTMKRTYQPSVARRKKTHGFLVRMKTAGGRAVINARRAKGRARVAV